MNISVLVTSSGGVTAVSVIKALRLQRSYKVRIIGADMQEKCVGAYLCDRHYAVPQPAGHAYINRIKDICRKERVKLLIPTSDSELPALSAAKEKLEKDGICVPVAGPATIEVCNDKLKTYDFLKQNGIPTPRTSGLAGARAKSWTMPAIIKPRYGRGSADVFKVKSRKDAAILGRYVEKPVIQDFVAGQEYTLDTLYDLKGRPLYVVPRKRIQTKAGVSVVGVTVRNRKLASFGKKVADALCLTGPANIQCIVNDRKGIQCIEINPRFSGALSLTVGAGLNGPELLMHLALQRKIPQQGLQYKSGLCMYRYWEEVFAE